MLGLMQDWPLLCHRIIEHAARYHGTQEVVTRSVEGPIHRTNYAEIHARALKVSQRLDRDGNGNHCRSHAAKGAISPFPACVLRGKVHVNSMNPPCDPPVQSADLAATNKTIGGKCVCSD